MKMRWTPLGLLALGLVLSAACGGGKSEQDAASAALDRGLQAHYAGQLEEAEKDYREVLVHDPKNEWAFYNLGVIEQSRGKDVAAESYYRSALETAPRMAVALYNLGIIRAKAGDLNGALDLYQRAVAAAPNNVGAHLNLGLLLQQLGRKAEGDAEIARAIELDPSVASRLPAGQSVTPEPIPESTTSP